MSMYDYRELKIYFPRDVAETIKREAKAQKLSEQEFVKQCVLQRLGFEDNIKEPNLPKVSVAN